MTHECSQQCEELAHDYVTALTLIKQNDPIPCSSHLFECVWQITNHILSHRESHAYNHIPWFDLVTIALWDLAKQLKEQSLECDSPIIHSMKRASIRSYSRQDTDKENYQRAIRITIYNCRALVSEHLNDTQQAMYYYRKCASVRPAPFEQQQEMQYAALNAFKRLSGSTMSESSSLSSDSSTMTCTCCGVEKSYMPVCSRCKSQPYCSIRCMKSDSFAHTSTCKK